MAKSSQADHKIVKELWEAIGCEEHRGISLASLKNAIFAIMKLPVDPIPLNSDCVPFESSYVGQYIDGVLHLNSDQAAKLHTQFKSLFFNKMATRRDRVVLDEHDHCPKLCGHSVELLKRSKTQRLHKNSECTLLNEVTKANLQLVKDCTFRPRINSSRGRSREHQYFLNKEYRNKSRFDQLYEISKNAQRRSDRRKEDIEYERQRAELTFVPRTLKQSVSSKKLGADIRKSSKVPLPHR